MQSRKRNLSEVPYCIVYEYSMRVPRLGPVPRSVRYSSTKMNRGTKMDGGTKWGTSTKMDRGTKMRTFNGAGTSDPSQSASQWRWDIGSQSICHCPTRPVNSRAARDVWSTMAHVYNLRTRFARCVTWALYKCIGPKSHMWRPVLANAR